jgi:protein-tyrosine phosphatase
MRRLAISATFGLALLHAAACVEEPGQDESFATMSKTLTLRFQGAGDGALSLKSSGKLLACAERFQGLEGERVTCEREAETVEVIVKASGASVVVVRDLDRKRGYYTCSRKGDVDGVPSEMKCKLTKIRPRGAGGLSSPFDPSVEGVTLPNAHWVDEGESILRGMEPRSEEQIEELREIGVDRVLIFKNATGDDDVGNETAAWALGAEDVLHVPFRWKDFVGFTEPCEQTLEALRFIRASREAGKKVFFHCTVGEDRTGYLAALHGLLFEGADARAAFDEDMCERGYASGNPQKPGFVLGKLEGGLTPLYRKMAFLVAEGTLTEALEQEACATEPTIPDDFMSEPLACGTSTTLVP